MPTCPDCGSIIMEGDPYCSHCGAHLSWSDDYESRGDSRIFNYEDDYFDDFMLNEKRRQELLEKISSHYKVELEDLDVKDTYTEYIFLRKTPYYTLRIVATDQFGGTIGIKRDSISADYTKLKENKDFQNLIKYLNIEKISVSLYEDEIRLYSGDKVYLLDTDNMKLMEEK